MPAVVKRMLLFGVTRPAAAAVLFVAVTAIFALQIPRLEIDASNEGLMLEHDPARQYYEQVKSTFGSDELTVVMAKADDVFAPAVLDIIHRLSEALARVEGVTRVDSLATVDNISADGDGLEIAPLLRGGVPRDPDALARIRTRALDNPMFVGNLVSPDARAAGLLIFTESAQNDREFNEGFSRQVDALLTRESASGVTLYQIGGPLIKATVADYVRRDQVTLIPLSAVTLFLVLLIGFRTPQGVAVPLVTGLASIVWGVGLMALFHIPMNVVTAAVPSLVLVVGFAEAVHIISAYHRLLRDGSGKLHALTEAVEEIALPILVTTATTILAFATLIATDITMLIQFGYAATLALTANFAATLLGVPLLLRLWPEPKNVRAGAFDAATEAGAGSARAAAATDFILRHRVPIAAGFALAAAASLWGWYSLRVDTDFTSYFREDSTIRQRMRDVDRSLAGASAFFVVVGAGGENRIADPAVLEQIVGLQTFLESVPGIDKTISIVDYVSQLHAAFSGQRPGPRAVPDSAEVVAQHLLVMDRNQTERFVDLPASSGTSL